MGEAGSAQSDQLALPVLPVFLTVQLSVFIQSLLIGGRPFIQSGCIRRRGRAGVGAAAASQLDDESYGAGIQCHLSWFFKVAGAPLSGQRQRVPIRRCFLLAHRDLASDTPP